MHAGDLEHMTKLARLNLGFSWFAGSSPLEINAPNLVKLELNECSIEVFPDLSKSPKIRHLTLNKNRLSRLKKEDALPEKLSILELRSNAFTENPDFSRHEYLSTVDLSSNQITDISGLMGQSVNTLNLQRNKISDLSMTRDPAYRRFGLKLWGNPVPKTPERCPKDSSNIMIREFCSELADIYGDPLL
jgi:hypothetical protein